MRALALVAAVLWYQSSAACAFSPEDLILDDPIAAMNGADAVFSATVVGQAALDRKATSRVSIEVDEVWKGHVSSLRTLDNYVGSTCSRALADGERYLFFASRRGKRLHVTGTFVPAAWATPVIQALRVRKL